MSEVPPERKFVNGILCGYMVSVISGLNSELVTYPLDTVKTRLQIQGELTFEHSQKVVHRGFFGTTAEIIREEGFFKLWNGLVTMFWRHLFYSGVRITMYRVLREEVFHNKHSEYFPMWQSAASGLASGMVGQFIANPAAVLKVQLQMENKRRLMGMPPRVDGIYDALRKNLAKGGVRTLWKGAVPNMWRAGLVNVGDLSSYDAAKQFILRNSQLQDNYITHGLASFVAGFVAAALGSPADTVTSRVMNQPLNEKGQGLLYKTPMDCIYKTISNEGSLALYKGFLPSWIRSGPWAMVFWFSYEQIAFFIGAQQF